MIPEEICNFFHNAATERPIYMAGYFSDRENEEPWTTYPMVLTTYRGNPKIFFWSYDSSARLDSESFSVMLARSSDESKVTFCTLNQYQLPSEGNNRERP